MAAANEEKEAAEAQEQNWFLLFLGLGFSPKIRFLCSVARCLLLKHFDFVLFSVIGVEEIMLHNGFRNMNPIRTIKVYPKKLFKNVTSQILKSFVFRKITNFERFRIWSVKNVRIRPFCVHQGYFSLWAFSMYVFIFFSKIEIVDLQYREFLYFKRKYRDKDRGGLEMV